ncbi:methyltransferase domain-containing protein [Streptomyces sp. NPDC001889]
MTHTETEPRPGWAALGRTLADRGVLPLHWAGAFNAVPRSMFLPDVIWPHDMESRTSQTLDRTADPEGWYTATEANIPITTQWDDGRHTGPAPGSMPTSSASMPSVVMEMLDALDIRDGHRVLEVGTGTGWNAGLLAHRLGDEQVVTMEVDETVADAARSALARAGLHPTVITGDGLLGHPARGPYDRIIATAGLRRIPYALVEQATPGAVVLAPWGTHFSTADRLVRLTVADDGRTASGPFGTPVEFMKARSQRLRIDQSAYLPDGFPGDSSTMVTALTSASAGFDDPLRHPFMTAAGFLVPDCMMLRARRGTALSVWLYSLTDRSWAAALIHDDDAESTVHQSGARPLWDELSTAHRWWTGKGQPDPRRFGLTVRPDGEEIWLDHPSQVMIAPAP